MADSSVQLAPESTGPKVQAYSNTVNSVADIRAQAAALVDQYGVPITSTGLRDIISAQRHTVMGDSLADGLAPWWTATLANGGTFTSTGGEGRLLTSTAAAGSAIATSPLIPYLPGQVAWMNSAVRMGDTGVAGNIRRIGMFTVSAGNPQEGFFFELTGATLNAVYVKGGVMTQVASTSWSKVAEDPFTLSADYVSFEIRYTANTVWFYVNNVMRHVVSGTSASLTNSLTLPITLQNTKTSGATDITLAVRNIGNGRFGTPPTRDGRAYREQCNYFMPLQVVAPAAETLCTLTGYKNGAAVAGTTTPAVVSAGKTYRIQSITMEYRGGAAFLGVQFRLRVNLTGVVLVGSPLVDNWTLGSVITTAGAQSPPSIQIYPEGLEFPSGAGIGMTFQGLATGGVTFAAAGPSRVSIAGYEY